LAFVAASVGAFAEADDADSLIGISLSPILIEILAGKSLLDDVVIVLLPVVGGGSNSGIRSSSRHIDIVADAASRMGTLGSIFGILEVFVDGFRSTGGIGVLADDDGTAVEKSLGSFLLGIVVIPGIGILDRHMDVVDTGSGLEAEVEGSIAGNDFGIVIGTDISDFIIVRISSVGSLAGLVGGNHIGKLKSADIAGDVTGFIDVVKGIVEIIESGNGSIVASHGNDLDVLVVLGELVGTILVSIGIGDNDLGSGIDDFLKIRLNRRSLFADLGLEDQVLFSRKTIRLESVLKSFDVSLGIGLGSVADRNHTNLEIVLGISRSLATSKTKSRNSNQRHHQYLFHWVSPFVG